MIRGWGNKEASSYATDLTKTVRCSVLTRPALFPSPPSSSSPCSVFTPSKLLRLTTSREKNKPTLPRRHTRITSLARIFWDQILWGVDKIIFKKLVLETFSNFAAERVPSSCFRLTSHESFSFVKII